MERINISNFKIISEEPRGYSDKYWVIDGQKKLIKYNGSVCKDQDVMECISSIILKHLGIKCVNVKLGYNPVSEVLKQMNIESRNCCIIDSFLENPADVTINLLNNPWPKKVNSDEQKNISSCFYKLFKIFEDLKGIKEEDLKQMKVDYIRMVLGDCIIDNEDRRLKNIEAIYNEKNATYRLAPSFDNGLAFNAFNIGDTEGYCYIGNQEFPVASIIEYIIKHYLEEVEDIIRNLELLIQNNLEQIISTYGQLISPEKLVYIYDYLNEVNQMIKETINKTQTKTK
ncbi:MAG: hypothetical protein HFH47_03085 [Bacilli bacterium]|nr:hypothetical protein [Bacilli bacterium]